jgi:hypothetical protein
MNTRKLREALFYLDDQKMTVEELRAMLFNVEDQDKEIEIGSDMWKKLEAFRVYFQGAKESRVRDLESLIRKAISEFEIGGKPSTALGRAVQSWRAEAIALLNREK